MNSVYIVLGALGVFTAGVVFYARRIAFQLDINPQEKTPAYTKYDGVDFVPAKHWLILFGHHFASIAGAAPIVGPVIAVSIWGWGPALLWIVLGSTLIGGVHDFTSLVVSVKSGGSSVADIAKDTISPRARYVFSLFVFFALILVVAVFGYLCAKTFVSDSRVILPSLGLIPVAIFIGFLIYRLKFSQFLSTLLGLLSLAGLIVLAQRYNFSFWKGNINIWLVILLIYAFFASTAPVNILLQPRDYLSAYLLFFGIGVGFSGIFITHPNFSAPWYIKGSAVRFHLWPLLFVTVACGALSGFHALIASGTTSKQLPNQKYARRIGYGAMILEGVLALLALLSVSAGLRFSSFQAIMAKSGPIVAFSRGFGTVVAPLLGKSGAMVGIIILNAFILTTLDTATRITRYIFEEITHIHNRWASTLVVIVLAGFLAWGGRWRTIWPTFGAANQLVASLTLFILSCWLLSRRRPFLFTFIPGLFMVATTIAALVVQIIRYFSKQEYLLLGISIVLIALALYIFSETLRVVFLKVKKR